MKETIKILEEIRDVVSSIWGVDITTRSKKLKFVMARNTYYFIARTIYQFNYTEIGEFVGKDHATVMHGIKMMDRRKEYPEYKYLISKSLNLYGIDYETGKEDENLDLNAKVIELEIENKKLKDVIKNSKDSKIMRMLVAISETHKKVVMVRLEAIIKMVSKTQFRKPISA